MSDKPGFPLSMQGWTTMTFFVHWFTLSIWRWSFFVCAYFLQTNPIMMRATKKNPTKKINRNPSQSLFFTGVFWTVGKDSTTWRYALAEVLPRLLAATQVYHPSSAKVTFSNRRTSACSSSRCCHNQIWINWINKRQSKRAVNLSN